MAKYKGKEITTPTDAMKSEARRGLEWRKEFKRGGTEVGVARARDISNGRELSIDTVRRMHSYFARHAVDKSGKDIIRGKRISICRPNRLGIVVGKQWTSLRRQSRQVSRRSRRAIRSKLDC